MKFSVKLLLLTLPLSLFYGCGDSKESSLPPSPNLIVKGSDGSSKFWSIKGTGGGTPVSFEVVMTKLWLSENANCSDAFLVGDVSSRPQWSDLVKNPTLLTGRVPGGTYHCMIFQMSDTILFKTPSSITDATTHVHCQPNTTYGMDIFRDDKEIWYNYDTNSTHKGKTDDAAVNALKTYAQAAAYSGRQLISTFASTGTGAEIKAAYSGFHEDGSGYNQLIPLTNPIVVPSSGTTEITLAWDFDNALSGDSTGDSHCWVEEAAVSVEF